MTIDTKSALTAYASMMNSCDSTQFEELLANEFRYTSQAVLTDISSKDEFVAYIRQKLKTIKQSNATVFAELGKLNAYGHQDCVLLAQDNKNNLIATVFATVDGEHIKQIDMCIVPPPSQVKRTGVYPLLNQINPAKMFVSYATEFDLYEGTKNWNELTLEQRNTIATSEFADSNVDIQKFVMETGLKKRQYAGIRALHVSSQMLNERLGFIKQDIKGEKDRFYVLAVFANTRFFKEINDLLTDKATLSTDYNGIELERLAQIGTEECLLDEMFDMSNSEAGHFIKSQLAPLHVTSTVNQVAKAIEATEQSNTPIAHSKSNKSFFDLFACVEVRWIKEEIRDYFNSTSYGCGDNALKEALKAAGDSDKAKYSIRVDQMKPLQVALIIIRNVAFHQLISGKHHIYRNTLTLLGNDYLKLFNDVMKLSVNLGYTTQEESKIESDELLAFIKNLG